MKRLTVRGFSLMLISSLRIICRNNNKQQRNKQTNEHPTTQNNNKNNPEYNNNTATTNNNQHHHQQNNNKQTKTKATNLEKSQGNFSVCCNFLDIIYHYINNNKLSESIWKKSMSVGKNKRYSCSCIIILCDISLVSFMQSKGKFLCYS